MDRIATDGPRHFGNDGDFAERGFGNFQTWRGDYEFRKNDILDSHDVYSVDGYYVAYETEDIIVKCTLKNGFRAAHFLTDEQKERFRRKQNIKE